MLRKIVTFFILVPLGIVLVVLSVANRQSVSLALNPFQPTDSVLSLTAPFFVFLFLAVIFGAVVGATATWLSQGKYRKRARVESKAALKWQAEADRNKVKPAQVQGPALPQLGAK